MVEKRAAEQNGQGPDSKKARPASAAAAGKPALNLEALQKAKALLEKQKQLKEKLKKLPQVAATTAAAAGTAAPSTAAVLAATAHPLAPGGIPPAAAAAAGGAGGLPLGVDAADVAAKAAKAVQIASKFGVQASLAGVPAATAVYSAAATAAAAAAARPILPMPPAAAGAAAAVRPSLGGAAAGAGPRPLLLDAAGREVDEFGNVIQQVKAPVASSLINQRRAASPSPPPPPVGPRDEDFIDPSVAAGRDAGHSHRRRRGALDFVEEGKFQRQAEIMRLKQKYGEADFKKHLPSHLRRAPRGPAGPELPAAAAAAMGDANLTPLGAPAIPALAGVTGVSDANLVPIGIPQEESEETKLRSRLPEMTAQIPAVEWWDKRLLEGGVYYSAAAATAAADGGQQQQQQQQEEDEEMDEGDQQLAKLAQEQQQQQQQQKLDNVIATAADGSGMVMRLRLGKITELVEHPIPLQPPAAAPPPPPQPLKLTKGELKKMRTQRRQAREKEKQELLRQGLLEPPKPKVKISNLMRVLGEQATLDPTAIEQEVRRQMNERQAAHDDRNLARMLTPAEKRDKKMRKLLDTADGGLTSLAAVYRVEDLSHWQHKFKVDKNAKDNHMSGIMLVCPGSFSLVVVEGCPKSMKRYHKLMLRRIDWNAKPLPVPGDDADEDLEVDEQTADDKPPNKCNLVWQGVVKDPAFQEFVKEEVASPEAARKILADRGVSHYWDAAANFDFDAAPLIELV